MSDPTNPLDWVVKAEEDFAAAKIMLKRSKPLLTTSCFHSQQCAEKYLKAMLVSKGVDFPKTHDLLILNTMCNDAGIFTGFTKEDLGRLSGYAVHTRYPGNPLIPEEAKDGLEIATNVRGFARTFLGLKK